MQQGVTLMKMILTTISCDLQLRTGSILRPRIFGRLQTGQNPVQIALKVQRPLVQRADTKGDLATHAVD